MPTFRDCLSSCKHALGKLLGPETLARMPMLCKDSHKAFRGFEVSFSKPQSLWTLSRLMTSAYWRLVGIPVANLMHVDDCVLAGLKEVCGHFYQDYQAHIRAFGLMQRLEIVSLGLQSPGLARFLQLVSSAPIRVLTLQSSRFEELDLRRLHCLTQLELVLDNWDMSRVYFPEDLADLTLRAWELGGSQQGLCEKLPVTLRRLKLCSLTFDSLDSLSRLTKLQVLRLVQCQILSSKLGSWSSLTEFHCSSVESLSFDMPLVTSLSFKGDSLAFGNLPVIRTLDLNISVWTQTLELQVSSFLALQSLTLDTAVTSGLTSAQLNVIFAALPRLESCSAPVEEPSHTLVSKTLVLLNLIFRGDLKYDSLRIPSGCYIMPKLRRLRLVHARAVECTLVASLQECELPNLQHVSCRWFSAPDKSLETQIAQFPRNPTYHTEPSFLSW